MSLCSCMEDDYRSSLSLLKKKSTSSCVVRQPILTRMVPAVPHDVWSGPQQ